MEKRLTSDQYAVLREDGTERPFTSVLLHEQDKGNFVCAGCDQDAFEAKQQRMTKDATTRLTRNMTVKKVPDTKG